MTSILQSNLRVVYSFPSRLGVPGIGMTAWHQAQGLIDRGIDLTVICGSCERPLVGAAKVVETMKFAGLRIPYRLLGHTRAYQHHDNSVASYLLEKWGSVDIVHCWPLGSLQTLRVANQIGVTSFLERPNTHTEHAYRVVSDECEKLGLSIPESHSHRFDRERLNREKAEYAEADCLACPSEAVARTFLARGFPKAALGLHRYGADPAMFFPARPDVWTNPAESIVAAFVGSCEPRKGLHYALQAWLGSGAAEHGQFIICGSFVTGYKEYLVARLQHPSIRVQGFTNDTASVLRKADVLLLPSIEEGSALVTYEARACGCVLLVSDAAGAHCTHMHDSLIHHAGDVRELTRQLAMLSSDPVLLARLRSNSLAGAPLLTWSHAAETLHQLYILALDSGKRNRETSGTSPSVPLGTTEREPVCSALMLGKAE